MKKGPIKVWYDYQINFSFVTDVYGSFPAAPSVLDPFIDKKIKDGKISDSRVVLTDKGCVELRNESMTIEQLHAAKLAEALETLPDAETMVEQRTLVFRRWNNALAFPGGNIRAHLKECARTLASLVLPKKVEGQRSLTQRATNGLYVRDTWVTLTRDGEAIREPEMTDEFLVHVIDPRTGIPRNSIKQCEGVKAPVEMSCTVAILGDIITTEELDLILQYGGMHAFGQERSRGMGRYTYTVTNLSEEPAPVTASDVPHGNELR